MNYKIIFVHGYTASPQADWYSNISRELKKLKIDFSIPLLPGGLYPKSKIWIDKICQEVKKTKKPIILVGHSLGSRVVLLFLEEYGSRVDKVILIAAFNNNPSNAQRKKGVYADFFDHEIDLEKIKKLAKKFIVMHSKDDDSIPYNQGVEIARQLGAKLITYKDRSHFSDPENYKYILEILLEELEN
ncbi:alpha/beta fold hydrolase [Candidatus Gottesmanbacteria bacterium]|nr:alpha/beta fold hydrolase [Candidatus Gottesmanbacteria bacterium]